MLLQEQAQTIFTVLSERSVVVDPHNSPFLFRDVQSYNTDIYADAASVHSQSEPASPQAVPNGTSAPATFLRFMCNDPMKNSAAGFVFGNDPATCDVYVQESLHVNKRLFAITINPNSGALIIKNLRNEGTLVCDNIKSDSLGKLSLPSSRALIPETIIVTLTDVKIHIKVLDQSDHADLHVPYLAQFYMRVTGGMPNLSALNLLSSGRYSGQQNRPYILNQEIGRGAYGVVHYAFHSQTGNAFAAKQFQDRRVNPLKEAAILQSLSHPHVVKYVDFVSMGDRNDPMLIMELVLGENLRSSHREQPLDLAEIQALTGQLLQGLQYLHRNHVTHRDLKPENVLLAQRSPIHAKLTDFGVATARSTSLRTFCGSECFMAPEVRSRSYTNRVDLWSLGIIVLELIVGLPAYPEHSGDWPALLKDRLESVTSIPACLLTEALLQQDPNRRATADEALAHEFFYTDFSMEAQTDAPNGETGHPEILDEFFDYTPGRGLTEILADVGNGEAAEPVGLPDLDEGVLVHDAPAIITPEERPTAPSPSTRIGSARAQGRGGARPALESSSAAPDLPQFWPLRYENTTIPYMLPQGLINVTLILKIWSRKSSLSLALRELNITYEPKTGGSRQGRILRYLAIESDVIRILEREKEKMVR